MGWAGNLKMSDMFPLGLTNDQSKLIRKINRLLGHRCEISRENFQPNQQLTYCSNQCTTRYGTSNVKLSLSGLLWLLLRAEGLVFFGYALLRLIVTCLEVVTTLWLELLMLYIGSNRDYPWHGILFALAMAANNLVYNIMLSQYFHASYSLVIRIKMILSNLLYRKTLHLSSGARAERSSGEISNLISVDVNKVGMSMIEASMIWNAPIQLAICVYLLYRQLGNSNLKIIKFLDLKMRF